MTKVLPALPSGPNLASIFSTQMEAIPCNFCGTDAPVPLHKISSFLIVRCSRCGLTYTNPRLKREALKAVYDNSYFKSANSLTHGYENYEKEQTSIQKTFRKRWQKILSYSSQKAGRVLDVGCAFGFLLDVARNDGWSVEGLDTSQQAVDYANQRLKLSVQISDLSDIPFADKSFDVITMWDVIEHLPDPTHALKNCFSKLKPGGLFSVITPDESSAFARLFKQRWVEYQKPHEHLYFFTQKNFCAALKRVGFEILWAGTASKHVTLEFALERLEAYQKKLFRVLGSLARKTGLANLTIRVNPYDKMSIIARRPFSS